MGIEGVLDCVDPSSEGESLVLYLSALNLQQMWSGYQRPCGPPQQMFPQQTAHLPAQPTVESKKKNTAPSPVARKSSTIDPEIDDSVLATDFFNWKERRSRPNETYSVILDQEWRMDDLKQMADSSSTPYVWLSKWTHLTELRAKSASQSSLASKYLLLLTALMLPAAGSRFRLRFDGDAIEAIYSRLLGLWLSLERSSLPNKLVARSDVVSTDPESSQVTSVPTKILLPTNVVSSLAISLTPSRLRWDLTVTLATFISLLSLNMVSYRDDGRFSVISPLLGGPVKS